MELANCNGGSGEGISLKRDFKCHFHLKRLPSLESVASSGSSAIHRIRKYSIEFVVPGYWSRDIVNLKQQILQIAETDKSNNVYSVCIL